MSDGFVKAYLLYEVDGGPMGRVDCMFNPEEITFKRSNAWSAPKPADGKKAPLQQFLGENPGSYSLTLYLDSTDKKTSVKADTLKLVGLMDIKKFGTECRPPFVFFNWGLDIASWPSVIKDLSMSYIYFGADGSPQRSKVEISLEQALGVDTWANQNPTSGTPDPHRQHQLQVGETLDRLSARYYGDATRWRLIADANGVSDPLALRPGRVLTIPQP